MIEIVTRSMNYDLYIESKTITDVLPYQRTRLLGTTADGYIYSLLRRSADWIINLDEDAFITDIDELEALLQYCIDNGYGNCGMPEGGVHLKNNSPIVTNPFFNIMDIASMREKYSKSKENEYATHKKEYEAVTPYHLINDDYRYIYNEPFCKFFVWSSQNFKTLYLDSEAHEDGISTILKSHRGKPFLVHTWYTRHYGKDTFHTTRINNIIDKYVATTQNERLNRKQTLQYIYNKYILDLLYNKINKRNFIKLWKILTFRR